MEAGPMTRTCSRCDREKVVSIQLDDTMDVCGHTFTAQLPAEKCEVCGQVVIQGQDVRLFELRVAVEIAKAGLRTAESFKYLRKAVGMEPESLAELLDVPAEFIGYWETESWPVDPRAHAVLCSLVLAKIAQKPSTLDPLRVLREPRKLSRKVRLTLIDAVGKNLSFGSTRPTLALA
jgi:DNA-binding transcriptional regulator YiaG